MNEGVQTLLYVHTSAKRKGTAHNDTNLATVHLVEDFQFLLNAHAALHHNDLLGGNSLRNQFLADVLIEVEATALVLIVVGKQRNRSAVGLRFAEAT